MPIRGSGSNTQAVLGCLLNRGLSAEEDAAWFADRRHDDLLRILLEYLNDHRHFLGYCRVRSCHALNERGVDVLLSAEDFKAGFQIKSYGDVRSDSFSGDVKRQFADALSYGLDHYYILICSPLFDGKKDLRSKINNLLNDFALYQHVKVTILDPTNAVNIFKEPTPISRDELLAQDVISEDFWHEYEIGYEHLPDVDDDDEIIAAQKFLDEFGEDWWDSEEGWKHIGHTSSSYNRNKPPNSLAPLPRSCLLKLKTREQG